MVQSDVGSVDARIAGRWAQAVATLGSTLPLQGEDPVDELAAPEAGDPEAQA
jgi:hypothetical protein